MSCGPKTARACAGSFKSDYRKLQPVVVFQTVHTTNLCYENPHATHNDRHLNRHDVLLPDGGGTPDEQPEGAGPDGLHAAPGLGRSGTDRQPGQVTRHRHAGLKRVAAAKEFDGYSVRRHFGRCIPRGLFRAGVLP